MGESVRIGHRFRMPTCILLTVFFFILPIQLAVCFDLSSFLSSLGGSTQTAKCPDQCSCTTRRAEAVMQDYVTKYLPAMGTHMKPDLKRQARATITVITSWFGSMADIRCNLTGGERVNLTDVLQASALSFKSLRLHCTQGAGVVWDVSAFNAFLNILDISGCQIQKAHNAESLAVPLNLWVLNLDRVAAESIPMLDLSTSVALLALSITNCNMSAVPQHWSDTLLYRLMLVNLANNKLNQYGCEVKASDLTAVNLDHNNISAIPSCILDGSKYTSFLSLRHNNIQNLKELWADKSEHEPPPVPQLFHLDVAYNKLSSLRALRKMQLLFGLDVSHNGLSDVAADTFLLQPSLEWLDMSHNLLEHVVDGALTGLLMIKHLNLSHNRLRSFDFDQSPLSTKIVTLDLRHNRLTYPPFADTGYVAPRLARISAANNPFACDCDMHIFLQFLSGLNNTKHQDWFGLGYWDIYESDPDVRQPYVDISQFECSQPADKKGMRISSLSFANACPLLRGCPSGCGCELIKSGREHLSVDCSKMENMVELPDSMPVVSDIPLVLYVNHTGLRRVAHRPYLHLVSEMYAGDNKLIAVTPGAMEALQNASVLSFHSNQLKSLPAITQNLTMSAATNISLGNNPWTCGCNDLWMPDWLTKHSSALYHADSVRCRWTGKLVTLLTPSDLNCGVFNYLPLVIALSMLLILALVTASLLVKYKMEVLVFLYTRFRIRPFDMYKYDHGQSSQFDIFVSFSQHDYRWVVEKLVDQLENRAKPYKLCIHLRDFPVGAPVADSVAWAVDNSRCTLLVLTRHFLASEWCRHEFRAAHTRLLKDRDAKLLIVVHGPLDARILDRDLLAYLRTNTYLKTEDRWFWTKLEYALPKAQEGVLMVGVPGQHAAQPPDIEMDTFMPVAMAAGDVHPKA